ncbi:deoxyribodipyrimidine photolyase [Xaviernesmea oryzae]|uniref:Deoxyribodipyrimidine photolyase n=1 Tax=Xaviernesmea oryzae TaxID=464029 RepID=A0A1Q9AVI9_9HYPH|nr:cryptochrome/photolyase family protein [Xaviernesmea oryzae]OLP59476.1 deoxyribodipyrimidine photolyase [Xaviernesmea oryzae]SEL58488.1 deoxyribodipyrimidine photolyase-related protein [Xaviernesmea oryzae]
MVSARNLILILGDQLSLDVSSLNGADPKIDRVVLCEVMEEATYVRHHPKKIAFLFSAMRHFAEALRHKGFSVDYTKLDDVDNSGSFTGEVRRAVRALRPERLIVTEPGEYRVAQAMAGWQRDFNLPVEIRDDRRFLCSRADFAAWAKGRKALRMEYFYRDMRRRTGLLMDGDQPVGGRWNFDAENRKPASQAGDDLFAPPARRAIRPDRITAQVLELVSARFSAHFGSLEGFDFAVTAKDAESLVDDFVTHHLPSFGDRQDAMLTADPVLSHSLLSFYVNAGLLDPLSVCRRVEAAYRAGKAPLNAAEGFIRQIIGWREYVRGIYWLQMPGYAENNALDASRALPDFYWTGETKMACVSAVVRQTRDMAYAHHIQRLMITGNFALLAGIDPQAVHRWYLEVYADAYEWVEMPNVIGMSQFADGGLLGSKPYAAGGSYINRMSNYCGGCAYDVKKKTGTDACPFNALYWDFLARHESRFRSNRRMAPVYASWARMAPETRKAYRESAAAFLRDLDRAPKTYGQIEPDQA